MILKSYFDGGNQADSRQYDRVTLATACGTNVQWRPFEEEWKGVLKRHNAPFLHTTAAVSLKNEFSSKEGWSRTTVDAFILDCVRVVEKHIAIPDKVQGMAPRPGLLVATLSIRMKDFLRARETDPETVAPTVTEICASESLAFCFKWGRMIGAHCGSFISVEDDPGTMFGIGALGRLDGYPRPHLGTPRLDLATTRRRARPWAGLVGSQTVSAATCRYAG